MTATEDLPPIGLTGQGRYAVTQPRSDGSSFVLSEHHNRPEADDHARQARLGNPGRWTVWDTVHHRTVIIHH